MKSFENLTIKQVKKEILAWEYDKENPQTIQVITIGQDPDADCYEQGDGHLCEQFYAEVMINDEVVNRGYEWDWEEETITSSFDPSQDDDDDDEDDDEPNVVAHLDYAAQHLDTLELSPAEDVDVNEVLPCKVTDIRMNYPFEVERGDFNVYKIAPAKTWGELLTETIKVFQREYEAGKAIAPHVLSDYIIERVDIHPNNIATIGIGS